MKGHIPAPYGVSPNPQIDLPPTTGSSGKYWGIERLVDAISGDYGKIGIRVDAGNLSRVCRSPDGSYRGYYVYDQGYPPPYPVTKVNNQTGAVVLTAEDVGAAVIKTISATGQANIAIGGTHTLNRSILNADIITARMNYMATTGRTYGDGPARIAFAIIKPDSPLKIDTAVFTISSDGLTLTLESADRCEINKSTGAVSCKKLESVLFGNVIATY